MDSRLIVASALSLMLAVCVLIVGAFESDADTEVDTSQPYYVVSIPGGDSATYQAETVTVTVDTNGNKDTLFVLDKDAEHEYVDEPGNNPYRIFITKVLDKPQWEGAALRIVIPEGTTLYAYGQTMSNAHVDFSDVFSSIEIEGTGSLYASIPYYTSNGQGGIGNYTGNAMVGFSGVPTTIGGITYRSSALFAGATTSDSSIQSTSMVIDGMTMIGSSVYAGSMYGDVGAAEIVLESLSADSGTKYVYGGNNCMGEVGSSYVYLRGCDVSSIYIYGGGSGTSSVVRANIIATGGTYNFIVGGGSGSSSVNHASITFGGDAVSRSHIYGGGMNGSCTGSVNVTVNGGCAQYSVYAGGFRSNVGTAVVNVTGGEIYRGVLAGGRGGSVDLGKVDDATINISDGIIGIQGDKDRGVFAGGGTDDESTGIVGHVVIRISGGQIYKVTNSDANVTTPVENENSNYTITGGSFSNSIDSSWVPDGYEIGYDSEGNMVVGESPEVDPPYNPGWGDDDDYIPIPPVVYEDSGEDDTVTIVACAAAAVVAAIMAVFLIIERRK